MPFRVLHFPFSILNFQLATLAACLFLLSCSDFSRTDPDELGVAWAGEGAASSSSNTASGLAISYSNLDYSAQTYKTITITSASSSITLMAENLNIGTMVSGTASTANQSIDALIEKYCYMDTEAEANCASDGGLYQWSEAMGLPSACNSISCVSQISKGNHQGICPTGWHLPKASEWDLLATMLGGSAVAGQKMKLNTTGNASWDASTFNDGNSSGFSAVPAGFRYCGGEFYNRGVANFWEASEDDASSAFYRDLSNGGADLYADYGSKANGFSVRCFKD